LERVISEVGVGRFLVCRLEAELVALSIEQVGETMRALPIEPVADAPPFVRGVSVIRGVPTPVVDLGSLLRGAPHEGGRFVVIKTGKRRVALSVSDVVGVRTLQASELGALPPLLGEAQKAIQQLGALDAQLLRVIESTRIVPESLWPLLEGRG
jgi:purine-binding chemotaxis protein CheW